MATRTGTRGDRRAAADSQRPPGQRPRRRQRARRERSAGERWQLRLAVLVALGVILVPLAVAHRRALNDFRQLEQDYIASREPSACALQGLTPYAFAVDRSGMDAELERLIRDAAGDLDDVARAFDARRAVLPWPRLEGARDALGEAIDAQRELYDAMINDPENSDDEHERFRQLNMTASVKIVDARSLLFVGAGEGWSRRALCDEPPPETPPGIEQHPGP